MSHCLCLFLRKEQPVCQQTKSNRGFNLNSLFNEMRVFTKIQGDDGILMIGNIDIYQIYWRQMHF